MNLLAVLLLLFPAEGFANNYVTGVKSSEQHHYSAARGVFSCRDGSKTVPYEFVNDDYCDCDDSSDEPGTSACSNGVFWCRNSDFREAQILSIEVNDGICNCCDGSDEPQGKCQDHCSQLAEKERQEKLRIYNIIKTGKDAIDAFEPKFGALRGRVEERIPASTRRLEQLERTVNSIQTLHGEILALLKEEKEAARVGWKESVGQQFGTALFRLIDWDADGKITEADANSSRVCEIFNLKQLCDFLTTTSEIDVVTFEQIWATMEDPFAIDVSLRGSESDSANFYYDTETQTEVESEEDSFDEKDDDNLPDDDQPDSDVEYGEDGVLINRQNREERRRSVQAPVSMVSRIYSLYDDMVEKLGEPTNARIEKLNEELKKAADSLENATLESEIVSKDVSRLQSFFQLDFGPRKAYAMMFDFCYNAQMQSFNFTVCPFYKCHQYLHGDESFVAGYWKGWSSDHPPYSTMLFDGGDTCGRNGVNRSTTVALKCYDKIKMQSVAETSYCHYEVELLTPAACVSQELPHVHEDL